MERKKSSPPPSALVLLLVTSDHAELESLLRQEGYTVVAATTADQAVALCLHNRFRAAFLDEDSLEEAEGWSVAQSLKMVRPNIPVLLLTKRPVPNQESVPKSIDCLVNEQDSGEVLKALKKLAGAAGIGISA